ncbi:hypothetical protein, partial [Salmonella enterica]|uniref:hypothetical protein n=1 Tax=Salmonella enterica TaxID=28901 RepID=UPI0020C369EF
MDRMTYGRGPVDGSFVWIPTCVSTFGVVSVRYWKLSFIGFLFKKLLQSLLEVRAKPYYVYKSVEYTMS